MEGEFKNGNIDGHVTAKKQMEKYSYFKMENSLKKLIIQIRKKTIMITMIM